MHVTIRFVQKADDQLLDSDSRFVSAAPLVNLLLITYRVGPDNLIDTQNTLLAVSCYASSSTRAWGSGNHQPAHWHDRSHRLIRNSKQLLDSNRQSGSIPLRSGRIAVQVAIRFMYKMQQISVLSTAYTCINDLIWFLIHRVGPGEKWNPIVRQTTLGLTNGSGTVSVAVNQSCRRLDGISANNIFLRIASKKARQLSFGVFILDHVHAVVPCRSKCNWFRYCHICMGMALHRRFPENFKFKISLMSTRASALSTVNSSCHNFLGKSSPGSCMAFVPLRRLQVLTIYLPGVQFLYLWIYLGAIVIAKLMEQLTEVRWPECPVETRTVTRPRLLC